MKISGFPGFDAAVAGSGLLRARVAELTAQVASGQRAQTLDGLGQDAAIALDLRNERARREAIATPARRSESFAEATQSALSGIHGTLRDVLDKAPRLLSNGVPGSDNAGIKMIADTARASLKTIVGLLGERFSGEALFGGAEPNRAPIVSAEAIETTGVFTQIRSQVESLAAGNGSAVLARTKGFAQSNDDAVSPFRGFAADAARGSQPDARRSVPVGQGIEIPVGMFAYKNSVSVSEGQTTGSWSRDLIWGLSVIANLRPPTADTQEDYRILVEGAVGALQSASNALIEDQAGLGIEQSRLAKSAERNESLVLQLETQIGKIETVDLSEAITQLTSARSQLEASYRAMVTLGDLSLTRFMR